MTDPVKPLSDDEVAEVAKRVAGNKPLRLYLAEFGIDVDALCATVRALRAELERMPLAQSALRQLDELRAANKRAADHTTALREQLAQAHSDNERLALAMQNVEEREAAICPEDVGFEEYIRTLKSRLTELENERNDLNRRLEIRPRAGYPWTGNEP